MTRTDAEELIHKLQAACSRQELRQLMGGGCRMADADLVNVLCAQAEEYERSDPRRALRAAEAGVYVSGLLGDPVCAASSIRAKATALRALGKYRRSISLYDRAIRAFQEQGLEVEAARTQINRIAALKYLGRYNEALAVATRARRVLLRHGEELQAAKLDANVGGVYQRMDRYEEALSLYDRARGVFARHGLHNFVAHVDVNRASILTQLNDFRQAEDAYLRARATFEAATLKSTVAMIDANLGLLYSSQGRYNRALERLNLARGAFEELAVSKNAAVVDLDLAEVYLTLNLPEEALELAERASMTCDTLGMRLETAQALATQAFARLQLGQHEAAAVLVAEARRAFEIEGNQVWTATLGLHRAALLSQQSASEQDLHEALELCKSARDTFRRRGLLAKGAYAQLVEGRLRESLGMAEDAALIYKSALRTASRLRLPWLLYQIHHALGRMEEKRAAWAIARQHYVSSIEALEKMWGDLRPEDLRTAFLTNRLQVYEDLILLCLKDGKLGAVEAFQCVERAKSRALVELLAGRLEVRVKDLGNQPLVAQLTALREELNWLYNKLSEGETPSGRSRQPWVEEITEQIREREVQAGKVLRQLQMGGEEYVSLQLTDTCSLETAQSLLDNDTSLVEYYMAGDELLVFVIDRKDVSVHRNLCSRAQIAALAKMLRFQFAKFSYGRAYVEAHFIPLVAAVNRHLHQMYDCLVRPIRPRLRGQKLIVVPHGVLHYLPFHAFYDGERYLAEDFKVSYSPSASVLRLCHQRPIRGISKALIMGLADQWAPLVAAEVDRLAAIFDSPTVLTGAEATADALRQCAPGCDVIHVACHGAYSPANPMFSRFRLADGWVSVHDVYNLELDASLVTLSACETGLNRVAAGDELIGLARGFLYAGTPSLLLSLWPVNDSSTVHFMQTFYRRLLAGESKAAALCGAQLEMKNEYVHPYYWAPFVLLGRDN